MDDSQFSGIYGQGNPGNPVEVHAVLTGRLPGRTGKDKGLRGEIEIGLRMANAISEFWWMRGHVAEGRSWLEGLLAQAGDSRSTSEVPARVQARALCTIGRFAMWQGAYALAIARLEQSAECAREAGDLSRLASALSDLGIVAALQYDLDGATARYTEALEVAHQAGDRYRVACAQGNLGIIVSYQGNLDMAATYLEAALATLYEMGNPEGIGGFLAESGRVARKSGHLDLARSRQREALQLLWGTGAPYGVAGALIALAATAGAEGEGERAARLLGAASAIAQEIGLPQPPLDRADAEEAVAATRAALGEEAWAAAFAAGRALSLEESVSEALGNGEEDLHA